MTLGELFKELKIHMDMGMENEEVYIVNRVLIPDQDGAIAEVEQELEEVEPGDGIEHIYLLGKID